MSHLLRRKKSSKSDGKTGSTLKSSIRSPHPASPNTQREFNELKGFTSSPPSVGSESGTEPDPVPDDTFDPKLLGSMSSGRPMTVYAPRNPTLGPRSNSFPLPTQGGPSLTEQQTKIPNLESARPMSVAQPGEIRSISAPIPPRTDMFPPVLPMGTTSLVLRQSSSGTSSPPFVGPAVVPTPVARPKPRGAITPPLLVIPRSVSPAIRDGTPQVSGPPMNLFPPLEESAQIISRQATPQILPPLPPPPPPPRQATPQIQPPFRQGTPSVAKPTRDTRPPLVLPLSRPPPAGGRRGHPKLSPIVDSVYYNDEEDEEEEE